MAIHTAFDDDLVMADRMTHHRRAAPRLFLVELIALSGSISTQVDTRLEAGKLRIHNYFSPYCPRIFCLPLHPARAKHQAPAQLTRLGCFRQGEPPDAFNPRR